MKIATPKLFKSRKEIKNFYEEHGWVLIKNTLKKEHISSIKKDLNKVSKDLFNKSFEKTIIYLNKINKKKLYEFHKMINQMLSSSFINSEINNIFNIVNNNRKPNFNIGSTFLLGLPKDKRLVYNFHQESSYIKNIKDITNIHFPIFRKTNVKNGTMSALDKSHSIKSLPYEKKIKKIFNEIYFRIDPGDILLFHKDLIHKSNYNFSNKPRVCFVGRFTQDTNIMKFKEASPKEL